MLALPEFDTYGCLPRFARHPEDPVAANMLWALKRRASSRIRWEAEKACVELGASASLPAVIKLRLGILPHGEAAGRASGSGFEGMSAEQVKDAVTRMLHAYKRDIDPGLIIDGEDAGR